jgi:hypothetical protein
MVGDGLPDEVIGVRHGAAMLRCDIGQVNESARVASARVASQIQATISVKCPVGALTGVKVAQNHMMSGNKRHNGCCAGPNGGSEKNLHKKNAMVKRWSALKIR